MKTSIIIQLLALPAIMAKLTIQIVSKPMYINAKVEAMRTANEAVTTTDASMFGEAGKVAQCLDNNNVWTTDCPDEPKYLKIGELYFDEDTEIPRPFKVKTDMGSWECDVTVEGGKGDYVWTMDGFLDADEPSPDPKEPNGLAKGVSIRCGQKASAELDLE